MPKPVCAKKRSGATGGSCGAVGVGPAVGDAAGATVGDGVGVRKLGLGGCTTGVGVNTWATGAASAGAGAPRHSQKGTLATSSASAGRTRSVVCIHLPPISGRARARQSVHSRRLPPASCVPQRTTAPCGAAHTTNLSRQQAASGQPLTHARGTNSCGSGDPLAIVTAVWRPARRGLVSVRARDREPTAHNIVPGAPRARFARHTHGWLTGGPAGSLN